MEKYREVGRQVKRVDARDKVTGRAMFTDDLCPKPCLVAKILHSTIGNGRVVSMDVTEAKAVPGVVAVFTCFGGVAETFHCATKVWSSVTVYLSPGWYSEPFQ